MKASCVEHVRYESGPNMVPLVDVVMVILIFLMLTGSFGLASHFFRSNAPLEAIKGVPNANKLPEVKILVTVAGEPGLFAKVNGRDLKSLEDLALHLAQLRVHYADCDKEGNPLPSDKRMPPPTVQLTAAGHQAYRSIIDAYQVIAACKYPRVGFRMTPEKAPAR